VLSAVFLARFEPDACGNNQQITANKLTLSVQRGRRQPPSLEELLPVFPLLSGKRKKEKKETGTSQQGSSPPTFYPVEPAEVQLFRGSNTCFSHDVL